MFSLSDAFTTTALPNFATPNNNTGLHQNQWQLTHVSQLSPSTPCFIHQTFLAFIRVATCFNFDISIIKKFPYNTKVAYWFPSQHLPLPVLGQNTAGFSKVLSWLHYV